MQIALDSKIIGVAWASPLMDKGLPSYDEALANACLMAAAPDLPEASTPTDCWRKTIGSSQHLEGTLALLRLM